MPCCCEFKVHTVTRRARFIMKILRTQNLEFLCYIAILLSYFTSRTHTQAHKQHSSSTSTYKQHTDKQHTSTQAYTSTQAHKHSTYTSTYKQAHIHKHKHTSTQHTGSTQTNTSKHTDEQHTSSTYTQAYNYIQAHKHTHTGSTQALLHTQPARQVPPVYYLRSTQHALEPALGGVATVQQRGTKHTPSSS